MTNMNSPLISASELKRQLSPGTVVLDCRFSLADPCLGEKQYEQGHIPGAYSFSLDFHLSGPVNRHGGRHPLPRVEQLAEELRAAGVTPVSQVVVYDDSRFGFAARAWWLLRYLGHDNVAVLDGGYQAWLDARYPVDRRQPPSRFGTFKRRVQSDWVVDMQQVKDIVANRSGILIDSREEKRFRGIEEPIDPVAGHIPGALNYPWQGVTSEQGYALPVAAQRARWEALPGDADMIVYCGSGVTACVNLLSLALAGRHAKLYPGSWSDWCSYEELPKATQL